MPQSFFQWFVGGILTLLTLVMLGFSSQVSAGGCYMPRVSMQGTAQTKQAIRMRSMPCMEEGYVVVTARGEESMTIIQESDGRYQLQRSDGTIGWIYYTWLVNINAKAATPQEAVKTYPFSMSMKKTLDSFIKQAKQLYPVLVDTDGSTMSNPKMDALIDRINTAKNKSPTMSGIFDYLLDGITQ